MLTSSTLLTTHTSFTLINGPFQTSEILINIYNIFFYQNAYKNVVHIVSAILSWPESVK